MVKKILAVITAVFCCTWANAQTPKWATDVAPILYNNCTSCHHDGGIAPFSLISYGSAVAYSSSIKIEVSLGKMPPWPPDRSYSRFAHERLLTATEISTIVDWINGGTPSGTLSMAPPEPVYTNTGAIPGTPDLVLKIPTYTSTADTGDIYQCFTIPSGLLTDKYIRAFEAIPGNPSIVHHVLVFADTTGKCASLDAAFLGPGYPDFGGVGSDSAFMVGVWVPGSDPMSFPPGFGLKIPRNADIVVQVHYPAGSAGMIDSTEIHFHFAPTTGIREVFMHSVLHHDFNMTNGPLVIPPNTVKTFHEKFSSVPIDVTLLGAFPHMHLLGQSIKSFVVRPAGDTDKLVRINEWDFHWQGFYMFSKLKKMPAGSELYAEATYDNTISNPHNPHNPPQLVTAGEATSDEMMIVFFVFTSYKVGDENIIVDSTVVSVPVNELKYYKGQQFLAVSPNPASDAVVLKCHFDDADACSVEMVDMQGRIMRRFTNKEMIKKGYSALEYSVKGILPGNYSMLIKTSERILVQKVVIVQ